MSQTNDGGNAFPVSRGHFAQDGKMLSADWAPGMTLRDWFAGQALSAMNISVHGDITENSLSIPPAVAADWAYCLADAMIGEREKEGSS